MQKIIKRNVLRGLCITLGLFTLSLITILIYQCTYTTSHILPFGFSGLYSQKTTKTIISNMAMKLQKKGYTVPFDISEQSFVLSATNFTTTIPFSRKSFNGKLVVNWIYDFNGEYSVHATITLPTKNKLIKIFKNDFNEIIHEEFIWFPKNITPSPLY
jgi:hypothetical protein